MITRPTFLFPFTARFFPILLLSIWFSYCSAQVTNNPDSVRYKPVDTAQKAVVLRPAPSTGKAPAFKYDSTFIPRKATIRSALIPGWGQIYNKQVWKLPFVYGAIGTTAGIFVWNLKNYRRFRQAYIDTTDNNPNTVVDPNLAVYSPGLLQVNRDQFRQNLDYSVIAFLIAWGINVVDATVSAHLKQFDVTDDLSLKIRPTLNPQTGLGVGLVVNFK